MQSLKQGVARTLALRAAESFWQERYYDPSAGSGFRQRAQTPANRLNFNVWSEKKFVERLRYIHRNPVTRGLVERAEDWDWSSFRHYFTGQRGVVEIESQWTARLRESAGIFPRVKVRTEENPRPSEAWTGHPSRDFEEL